MLKKAEIFVKNNSKSTEAFEEVRTQALAIAEKYEMEAATTTSLLTGAVETLKELTENEPENGFMHNQQRKSRKLHSATLQN